MKQKGMDRCGHALTSKQQIADMARGGLAQTREQRLALLDGLTTGKQAPSANALEVVARGLVLARQAAQGLGRSLGHERHQQVSGNADSLEQVVDHKCQLVSLGLVLGKRPGLGVLDVVVMATKLSLSLADYVITEAGFGADLGAEKFLDIKCRYAGIAPSACVLVATVRALKSHGGVAKADLSQPNLEAVKAGASNLVRHIDNLKNGFGLPVVVAINAFPTDTPEEQAYVEQVCAEQGVPCVLSEVFAKGGEGGKALAEKVLEVMEDRPIQYVYPLEMPLKQKVEAIAKKIYRADGVNFSAAASKTLAELTELGYGDLPVCIAKTQYSFSDNAKLTGAPTGFTMEVREVRLAAGAGFVVVICGNIMTMPGLPKKPAAVNIDVDAEGKITGLF